MTNANELHALNTAESLIPQAAMMQKAPPEMIKIMFPIYLIEHENGLVLFDTGLSHELVEDPMSYGEHGAPMMAEFMEAQMEIDLLATPAELLDDLGYETSDVDHLVMSHLHVDHSGYIDQFPDAEIHVHIDELRYAWWPDPSQVQFYLDGDLWILQEPDTNVTEVSGRTDLFGDGSIEIIPTPGHTPGHQSLKVELEDETVILAGDVANQREGYERGLVAPFSWSGDQALDSIRAVKAAANSENTTVAVPHAPDDLERLTHHTSR
jgi:glyoxylase-like metal-dependent hydrolase (beta-lactamase superfamily II)